MSCTRRALLVPCLLALTSSGSSWAVGDKMTALTMTGVVPKPVRARPTGGTFTLGPSARIVVAPGTAELKRIGRYLADSLNRATGYRIKVSTRAGDIRLATDRGAALGDEGYELVVTRDSVTLSAHRPAGLFWGVQTLRQLLPPSIESPKPQPGPWRLPTGTIEDHPRFAWRGVMLDVARHFFVAPDVERFIDLMAYYKLNRLHLHLSDDQGWRIAIKSWPKLAAHGGSTEVGGGRGGYYTQRQYSQIVAYARSRFIVVVPEIDMPGHTNAALSSYPELNCNGVAPSLYTGRNAAFGSLCTRKAVTYSFVEDVVRELAQLTPGPYLHIGGDEAQATTPGGYVRFVERVQEIVKRHGKRMIGWEEISRCKLLPTSIAQHWHDELARRAVEQGAKVIMSPASKAYLDMKYDASTGLGLTWAGYTDVRDAYTWDPATQLEGVSERDVLGVEAPLWSETLETLADVEFMAFPRLAGHAEIAWSPRTGRTWAEYRKRLALQGPRLTAMGVSFYRSPEVPWP